MNFQIALAQIKPFLGDVKRNLDIHLDFIDRAAGQGAGLVVFPELSLTGYYLEDLSADVAFEPDRSPVLDAIREATRKRKIDVACGFVEVASDFRFFNSAAYLSGGEILHVHRKVYLPTYGMFDEGRFLAPGDVLRAFDTRFGRMAILICEDLWHPATLYLMAHDDAQILLAMSAGPGRGLRREEKFGSTYAWEAITRSAAQAYLLYVAYVNRIGVEDGVIFSGGSELINPFGQCTIKAKEMDEDLCIAEIDMLELRRARTLYPLLRDERLDLTLRELKRIYRKRYQLD